MSARRTLRALLDLQELPLHHDIGLASYKSRSSWLVRLVGSSKTERAMYADKKHNYN